MTEINRSEQYERLLALPVMTTWTAARQQEHIEDANAYDAALAAVQAGLRSQYVDGDGRWAAGRRARKVEKHLRSMAKAARQQAAAAEKLRTAFADHVRTVEALPAQREAKRQAKELRRNGGRGAVAELAAKSLHKTAAATIPAPAATEAAETTVPAGPAPVRGINDLWKRGA
ncbi:hypothetical protein ACFV6U_37755 [Streptomyces sp. NPDC059810]|uniref:hypothetical protein n=1 Tax=Streptomyces sp. NPDC059810 TaxID=3346956 RepID=UPI003649BD87